MSLQKINTTTVDTFLEILKRHGITVTVWNDHYYDNVNDELDPNDLESPEHEWDVYICPFAQGDDVDGAILNLYGREPEDEEDFEDDPFVEELENEIFPLNLGQVLICSDDGIFYKIEITFEDRETEDWFSKELLKRGIPLHRNKQ